ncbi:squalene monooxygenase [Apiospora saccharicola]|uniref:Squalene monooxygenase n=1 Tax=Apiospora saccharicola TaxID=335842 RepID=A0ABR1ULD9_9PEZI
MATRTETRDEREERRVTYHEADVVVVGAGVFGCAIAHALASQNRSVLLLERWMKEPDRIVGELMQPAGMASLRKLGLGHCAEGIDAAPCYGYNVINYGEEAVISFPKLDRVGAEHLAPYVLMSDATQNGHANGNGNGHANGNGSVNGKAKRDMIGRPEGRAFHHGRFIAQLRKACLAHPNITVVETEAVATIKGENAKEILGVEARTVDPDTGKKKPDFFFGQLTIVADGYASIFRKQYVGRMPEVRSKFYALELIDCPLPEVGYGHVCCGDKTVVLLYQIGTHETRALIDVPLNCPDASPAKGGVRGYMANVVLPQLPAVIQPSFRAALEKDDKIPRSMPNSWLPPSRQDTNPGIVVLGDAMNMRHPLTGGGMTVALNDVLLLSELLAPSQIANLGDSAAVSKAMAKFHWQRKSLTSIINVLAMALYSLFSAADPNLAVLRKGCFAYFKKGVVDEPVGMLGGLIQRPLTLAYHFFTVAFLAVWIDWKERGLWNVPVNLWKGISIIWTACVVFLPIMYREAL